MARKFFKCLLPDPEWVKNHPSLQVLGDWLHDPNLWHLNRNSVSSAMFIGLFAAFIPLPTQMIIAAFCAMLLRANLPLSVCLVWITNPLTMAPIFFIAYKVGAAVLGTDADAFQFELSWNWIENGLVNIWQPFLLGCLLCGLFFGLLGSTGVRYLWHLHTARRWHKRRLERQQRNNHYS